MGRRDGMGRLEPAAISGVMSREVANFRTYWRGTAFSSILEPTKRDSCIRDVAGEAVEGVNDDPVCFASFHPGQCFLEPWSVILGPGLVEIL